MTTIKESGEPRTEDGVRVWPLRDWRHALRTARPELVITHHGDRKARRITSQAASIPHLLMVHGMSEARDLGNPGLAWFPSEACRDHYADYRGQALVLSPPISPVRYRTTPGSMVTLNGSTVEKGADVLAQVAARMPEMRFLMVRADGHTAGALPPNVVVADRTDPRRIYAQTQVLLMPSTTESYGRAGVEAMLSGIPVIAAPLPGIREALGDAATYIPREDVGRWVTELHAAYRPCGLRRGVGPVPHPRQRPRLRREPVGFRGRVPESPSPAHPTAGPGCTPARSAQERAAGHERVMKDPGG